MRCDVVEESSHENDCISPESSLSIRNGSRSRDVARYPELPGCISVGETVDSVVKNMEDAKRAWFEAALKEG